MKKLYSLLGLLLILSCDQKPPDPIELYNAYRNSVVLIQNSYYYESTTNNGLNFYFTVEDGELVLHDEKEEAIENAGISYGSGFFISDKGEIATNRHVIYPLIDEDEVSEFINEKFRAFRFRLQKDINDALNEQSTIASIYNEYQKYLDHEEKEELRERFYDSKDKALKLKTILDNLDFDPRKTKTELKHIFLGIAFDNTHVTDQRDFKECVALKKANNELVDLAIIQLKDKTTPGRVNQMFSIESIKSDKKPMINDPVYMIGFNYGIILAQTRDGIKSQFTSGTLTQDPNDERVLYSIPTLPGSSGSPIIDQWGNLIAINFAKTYDYQSFSFGIPSKHLVDLYHEAIPSNYKPYTPAQDFDNIPEAQVTDFEKSDNYNKPTDNFKTASLESNIRGFVTAENERDFEKIYNYFSDSQIKRYWDLKYPTKIDLREQYDRSWSYTSNAKNKIISINRLDEYTYVYKTIFGYLENKSGNWYRVESEIRIQFNSQGKIIDITSISSDRSLADKWVNYE